MFLYAVVPGYRNFLREAISGNSSVPVIAASEPVVDKKAPVEENKMTLEELKKKYDVSSMECTEEACEEGAELTIVDKTYYEDCGTGNGYWVITYSDGSTAVE